MNDRRPRRLGVISAALIFDVLVWSAPAQAQQAVPGVAMANLRSESPQTFRLQVGGRIYDFAQALRLKPAQTSAGPVNIIHDFAFTHPGLLNDRRELDLVSEKIRRREQPWATEFEKLRRSCYADRAYLAKMPLPPAVISCDFSGSNDHGSLREMKDANAAYTQALMWYFTREKIYAENAAGILDTYARTVTSHEGKNWYLEAAWAGSVFPLSAELLRATYPEWTNHRGVGKWFNDVLLPPLYDRIAFGNREFAILGAFAAIGIYNEDRAALYLALNHWMNYIPAYHYLPEDGPSPRLPDYWTPDNTPSDEFLLELNRNSFPKDWTPWIMLNREKWNRTMLHGKFGDDSTGLTRDVRTGTVGTWNGAPSTFLSGYCAETARDFGHVEQSFASEINVAEMAWHQGIDIYSPHARRITTFMETQAGLRLGERPPESMTTPLVPYGLVCTYEIALNHYAGRMGQPLPYTRRIVEALRHADVRGTQPVQPGEAGRDPSDPRLWKYPEPIPSLFASKIGEPVGWISSWEALTHGDLDVR